MSPVAHQIIDMVDMLPSEEQELAYQFIKRLVLAWDPDYTKLTNDEHQALENGLKELEANEVMSSEQIDWS